MSKEQALAIFESYKIRRVYDEKSETWYFSVVDVVAALTDSVNPRDYWFKMKIRVKTEDGFQLSTICRQLKLKAPDGKMRETDCANVQGLLRIIQSIPSPKAEPFKQWLAKVGYERIKGLRKNKYTGSGDSTGSSCFALDANHQRAKQIRRLLRPYDKTVY